VEATRAARAALAGESPEMTSGSGRSVAMVVYNDLVHDARVHKEARTLLEAGYAVHVVGMRTAATPALAGWEGIPATRLDVGSSPSLRVRYARFWNAAYRWLMRERPDAIHAHDLDALPPCWLAAALRGVPLVHDAHELWVELPSLVGRRVIRGVWSAIARTLIPRCDAVITVADGIAQEMARRYGVAPVVVRNLPPRGEPPAPQPLREKLGCAADAPLLIYQGGLLPGLGVDRAIAIMEHLPGAHLVIIGGGPLGDALRQQAAQSPASGRITFLPPVPFGELAAFTAAADVGLFLGESEGLNLRLALPNKLFEYIAAGVPVVAVDWPETGRLVRRYDVGRLVPPGSSPEVAAETIREVLAARAALAENCRRAAEELVWENEAVRLVRCYEELPWA